jgi:hypothetical protein
MTDPELPTIGRRIRMPLFPGGPPNAAPIPFSAEPCGLTTVLRGVDCRKVELDHGIDGIALVQLYLPDGYESCDYTPLPGEGGATYFDGKTWCWVLPADATTSLTLSVSGTGGYATIAAPEGTQMSARRDCVWPTHPRFSQCRFDLVYPTGNVRAFAVATWQIAPQHWLKGLAYSSDPARVEEICAVFRTASFD